MSESRCRRWREPLPGPCKSAHLCCCGYVCGLGMYACIWWSEKGHSQLICPSCFLLRDWSWGKQPLNVDDLYSVTLQWRRTGMCWGEVCLVTLPRQEVTTGVWADGNEALVVLSQKGCGLLWNTTLTLQGKHFCGSVALIWVWCHWHCAFTLLLSSGCLYFFLVLISIQSVQFKPCFNPVLVRF